MANRIYYIADLDFSNKNASSSRIINNCKSLTFNSDVQVEIIGCSQKDDFCYEGIIIRNIKPTTHFFNRIINIFGRGLSFVKKIQKVKDLDCVIYYGISTLVLLPLYLYCKKNRIKLIVDVVEWYDYNHLPYGRFGPFAFDVHFAITKLIPRCDGVIVISSFLQKYFAKKKLSVLLIPPLVDTKQREFGSKKHRLITDSHSLNLIYAGFPGKKDLIFVMIEAVEELNLNNFKVKLHILGPTKENLRKMYSIELSDNIICYGKIEQNLIPEYLTEADFSLLIRTRDRYAAAGFPTKFVESMNAALPVISNLTSDLNLYLKDGINGFVLKDCTKSVVIDKIRDISNMEILFNGMKVMAKSTAIENFDFRLFSNALRNFC